MGYLKTLGGVGGLRWGENLKRSGCWVNHEMIRESKKTSYKGIVVQDICSQGWGCKGNLTVEGCNNLPNYGISATNRKKAHCALKIRQKVRWGFELANCGRGCKYLNMDSRY